MVHVNFEQLQLFFLPYILRYVFLILITHINVHKQKFPSMKYF